MSCSPLTKISGCFANTPPLPADMIHAKRHIRSLIESGVSCRGKFAIAQGPLVYFLEGYDNPDVDIFQVPVNPHSLSAEYDPQLLRGVTKIVGQTQDGKSLTFIRVFHPLASTHAGRTKKRVANLPPSFCLRLSVNYFPKPILVPTESSTPRSTSAETSGRSVVTDTLASDLACPWDWVDKLPIVESA